MTSITIPGTPVKPRAVQLPLSIERLRRLIPGLGAAIDGETVDVQADHVRLITLLARVRNLMEDGQWRTLEEIQGRAGGTEASVSARLRDLRKAKHGGYTVERRRRGELAAGLHEYRVSTGPVEE